MPFSPTQPPEDITKCPKCASHAFYVLETRSNREDTRRRRYCKQCEYRATFYEVSKERYLQFQADSKALSRLLDQLQSLLDTRGEQSQEVKVPKVKSIPCKDCSYAPEGKCSFEYPEAFTLEAHDCSMFIQKH